MAEPYELKSEMFESLIKMVEADKITFTERYDNRGYLLRSEVDEKLMAKKRKEIKDKLDKLNLSSVEYDERFEEELSRIDSAKTSTYNLSLEEEIALVQIDAMKEEIVNICRIKRDSGKDGFKLPAHKDSETGVSESTLHDDRAYALAILGWILAEKCREHIKNKQKPKKSFSVNVLPITKGTRKSIMDL